MKNKTLKYLRLSGCPIFQQLQIEETLFRMRCDNWCLINDGTPPAIVMGRTQKPEEVVDIDQARKEKIPLIQRLSGGGCVVVDENTLFFTLICQDLSFEVNPCTVLEWTHTLLQPAFLPHTVRLESQDFALESFKIGGTAQSISKGRFLHHISFLWSYDKQRMSLLPHPPKEPVWRKKRPHENFLGRLQEYYPSKEHLIQNFVRAIADVFTIEKASLEEVQKLPFHPSRSLILDKNGSLVRE